MKRLGIYTLLIAVALLSSCIYEYEAEGVTQAEGIKVIEGDILIGSESVFSISETSGLNSESSLKSVKATSVTVECEDGTVYPGVYGEESSGAFADNIRMIYTVNTVSADTDKRYRLKVELPGGSYSTDYLDVYVSPEIDSLSYIINDDSTNVRITVNTHSDDPEVTNYKWTYKEDWEVRAHYPAYYYYDIATDTILRLNFQTENRYYCWNTNRSSDILVANTQGLSGNTISGQPVTEIYKDDKRLSYLYCIQVTQQALGDEGYTYWRTIKQNNDGLGGIFSPQPSEMEGNIHCDTDGNEVVLGYISAGTITRLRRFFYANDIDLYHFHHNCVKEEVPDETEWLARFQLGWEVGDVSISGVPTWYEKGCVDCREYGSKVKPDFWPGNYQ